MRGSHPASGRCTAPEAQHCAQAGSELSTVAINSTVTSYSCQLDEIEPKPDSSRVSIRPISMAILTPKHECSSMQYSSSQFGKRLHSGNSACLTTLENASHCG